MKLKKPIKTVKIAGKTIKYYNNKKTPSKKTIREIYKKLPDNKNIPVHFMTRKQYLVNYIVNQEKKNKVNYTPKQEKAYIKSEMKEYNNIAARYTTRSNPYYPKAVVFFNDKPMTKKQFKFTAAHEHSHEKLERTGKSMGGMTEEIYCDNVARDYTSKNKKLRLSNKERDWIVNQYHAEPEELPDYEVEDAISDYREYNTKEANSNSLNWFKTHLKTDKSSKDLTVKGKLANTALLKRQNKPNYEHDTLGLPFGHSQSLNTKRNLIFKDTKNGYEVINSINKVSDELNFRKEYKKDFNLIENDLNSKNNNYVSSMPGQDGFSRNMASGGVSTAAGVVATQGQYSLPVMQVSNAVKKTMASSSGISSSPSSMSQKRPTRKKVFLSPMNRILKDEKNKDYISIKDLDGNIIELKSKPKEYKKELFVENRRTKNEVKGEYSDHVITFDKKGNILKEVFKKPYQTYMIDNQRSKQYRSNQGIMDSKIIEYSGNTPVTVEEYGTKTDAGRSDRYYTRMSSSPYLKSEHDYAGNTDIIYTKPTGRVSGTQGNIGMALQNASSTVIKNVEGPDNEIVQMIDRTQELEQARSQEKDKRLKAFYSTNPSFFKKKKDEEKKDEEKKQSMMYGNMLK